MNQRLPARIDREAFDRVIKRAAELQAHGRDIGEGLTEDEVLALGKEVGIPEAQLRQALLEEQTRVAAPAPSGLADRWAGPATVLAERVVQGTPESIGLALTAWFSEHEVLVVQRSTAQRISWEQASGFASAMKRMGWSFNANRAKPFLDRAELVTGLITPLEPGFCHVTLVAQLGKARSGYLAGGPHSAASPRWARWCSRRWVRRSSWPVGWLSPPAWVGGRSGARIVPWWSARSSGWSEPSTNWSGGPPPR